MEGERLTGKKILFIPRWYPDRNDPMPGLFIEQLASALSSSYTLAVIYPVIDDQISQRILAEIRSESGLKVIRVYYRRFKNGLFRPLNPVLFLVAFMKGLAMLEGFVPDLIHAHVLTRHAILAWYCSRRFKSPYIISEHWSRYLPQTSPQPGWLNLMIARKVVKKASAFLPVSATLAEAMRNCGIIHPRTVILGNFVDETLFRPAPERRNSPVINILHVSCFDDRSKNISGLLEAIISISEKRSDFTLTLAGTGPDFKSIKDYVELTGLGEKIVKFAGLLTSDDMVRAYQGADFLVQSSRFETFGSVVIEALACGIPVLATATGIAAEVINTDNGILIETDDKKAFAPALNRMLDSCRSYNPETLRGSVTGRFGRTALVQRVKDLYNNILSGE